MARVLSDALVRICRLSVRPLSTRAQVYALARIKEQIEPCYTNHSRYGPIIFYCPATWPYSRSDMKKERKTYEWIDGFNEGDVFWDIGANVGVFSLYAAKRGLRVFAFEPAAVNYFVFAKNVELNRLDDRITFLNVAIGAESGVDRLYMSHTVIGGAQHSYARQQEGAQLQKSYAQANYFAQSVIGFSIDDFIDTYKVPVPSHIKIDVDGTEVDIVKGAERTLANPSVKTVLVEVRPDERREYVFEAMKGAGFELAATHGMNCIFRRNAA